MPVIVHGHGDRIDDAKTLVPVGTTLTFYSGFDVDLSSVVGLTAMVNGTAAPAKETVVGSGKPTDVANYQYSTIEDDNIARWLAMGGQSDIPVKIVGADIRDGTRLCSAPDICEQEGSHLCSGVLGTVQDAHIIIVACRGYVKAERRPVEERYGTEGHPLHEIDSDLESWLAEFYKTAETDPVQAESQADGLSQGTVAILGKYPRFYAWQRARHLKEMAASGDFVSMVGHLIANEEDAKPIMDWLNDCPAYGSAVDSAIETDASRFMSEVYDRVPNSVQVELIERKPVRKAYAARTSPGSAPKGDDGLDSDGFTFSEWQPTDADVQAAQDQNRANIEAAASGDHLTVTASDPLVIVGKGHNPFAVEYVEGQLGFETGSVKVTKGGAFGPSFEVTGIIGWENLVKDNFAALSFKRVSFS